MLYFAYGSNMCSGRLRRRVPSAEPLFIACLSGHRLSFDKRSNDGSGKADAEHTGDDNCVWGVVFEIETVEKEALDQAEALGSGYEEKTVTLDGPFGKCAATMYYATDKDAVRKPYSWYLRFVVEGARQHGLPADYVFSLEHIESIDDPDPSRDSQNRSIPC